MSYRKLLIAFILIFTSNRVYPQKEYHNWHFGKNAAISFNTGVPVVLPNSIMNSSEASASISDKNGNLLFYVKGDLVFNRLHNTMQNGTGLLGNYSSTMIQIVPQPAVSPRFYFIFTTDGAENHLVNGLRYSIVDITLDGGNGAVIEKNILLLNSSTERVAVTKHANGNDFWIVAHGWGNRNFYAYHMSAAGLNDNPVTSSIGNIHIGGVGGPLTNNYTNSIGYMKFSPSSNKLAVAIHDDGVIQLFSFNNSSGTVSEVVATTSSWKYVYGIEFSPNENVLYASVIYNNSKLIQFNIENNSLDDYLIIASGNNTINGLQIGPDEKIYNPQTETHFLGVINNPNNIGLTCNYTPDAINLGAATAYRGLPPIIPAYVPFLKINADGNCVNTPITFDFETGAVIDSVLWDFGDPGSGPLNISRDINGLHEYDDAKTYTVSLASFKDGIKRTVREEFSFHNVVDVDLGNDTAFCENESVTLDLSHIPGTFKWSDGSTLSSLTILNSGEYYVDVTGNCGKSGDTIIVTRADIPDVLITRDTTVCAGASLVLAASSLPGLSYEWSTKSTLNSITLTPLQGTTVDLDVKNEYNCARSFSVIIRTRNCFEDIIVPNVFTPNQDSFNDYWIIKDLEQYPNVEVAVFTRWGTKVFESRGYEIPWDGTYSGEQLSVGCYYYVIMLNNGTAALTGTVSIYR
jgi:gliding motility-associated-like protein